MAIPSVAKLGRIETCKTACHRNSHYFLQNYAKTIEMLKMTGESSEAGGEIAIRFSFSK
jgi:hypothetical protein